MSNLSSYFVLIVDMATTIKKNETIPKEYQNDFEDWMHQTKNLLDKLRGFKILDTLPYSKMVDMKTGKIIKESFK